MDDLFNRKNSGVDTRRRRRIFKIAIKIQHVSAVVIVWLILMAVLYSAYTVAFLKPYFRVNRIDVAGDFKVLTEEDIIKMSGIKYGDHILRVSVDAAQSALMENPWIKEAAVHRKLPRMIWIYVKEYVPEAIAKIGDWHYVDNFGEIFKKVDTDEERDFPIITGLENSELDLSDDKLKEMVMEILKVKRVYERSFIGEIYGISEVHYDPNRGISIITLNEPMEFRLGFGPYSEKISRFQTVYSAIRSNGGVVSYVDLSSDGKVVVKYGT